MRQNFKLVVCIRPPLDPHAQAEARALDDGLHRSGQEFLRYMSAKELPRRDVVVRRTPLEGSEGDVELWEVRGYDTALNANCG